MTPWFWELGVFHMVQQWNDLFSPRPVLSPAGKKTGGERKGNFKLHVGRAVRNEQCSQGEQEQKEHEEPRAPMAPALQGHVVLAFVV